MARFSATENELIGQIKDDRLASNLAKIREAIEDLWPNDPVRIVLHYTDHGVKHSERVADYASIILKANKGTPLSDQEMYLLLAGIYLHDIGMQCDVVKFPKIARHAEKIGAKFNIKFELIDGVLSKEMQKSIRKNHQFLTAAWIDYASRTGDTRLGMVAKEIPPDLVDDLIDICKFHSKLSIKECPIKFNYSKRDRKQLIAAILRFADELDIDAHRVSLETVKNFSIDPKNSVYWWLHNRTSIDFITSNVISIMLQLHPIDNKNYGHLIKHLFIDKFCKKNEPLIDILCENHIPLHISSESQIEENDRVESLPGYIVDALKKMKRYDETSEEIDKANHSSHPNSASVWTNKGIALENLGQYKDALEAYESSIRLDPNHAPAWTNKGIILRKIGKYEEALKSLEKSIELGPNNVSAWISKGMILENLGRYKEAIKAYKNAVELEPNYLPALTNRVASLEKLCRYRAAAEYKELKGYPEIEKEIFEKMEIEALQKEEPELLNLMDREAAEEAEIEFEEWQDIDSDLAEERAAFLNKAKENEKINFLNKMGEVARAEKAIEIAEAQETVICLETEKEILDEMERKAIQMEEATLLSLMDREAAVEAEMQFNELRYIDIYLAEERAALLNKIREKEKEAFLKKMDEVAVAEKAIEVAEVQETAADLETENEILDERERKAIQMEEATLLNLMDREAAEEAEAEFNESKSNDGYHAEKIEAFLNKAKEKEKADFLKKMDGVARAEMAIEVAEAQKTVKYLEIENEILDERQRKAVQMEEATLLNLMDREAAEEAEMEFHEWPNIDSFLAEERSAHINKVSEKEKADFLKKVEAVSKELMATEVEESQETAADLETEKEILDEIERKVLQKEEANILSLIDREVAEEADVELMKSQDIDSYLADDRADFLKIMEEKAREEDDLEDYLDKERITWG